MQEKFINKIFEAFSSNNPDPKIELDYINKFTLLIATLLSARATDVSVNKATKDLFKDHNSPQTMLALGEDGLKSYINTIGLYNAKATNIIKLSKILIDHYDGQVPGVFDDLVKLPGVGRKTANVVLNSGFGKPTIPVDTHIFRVSKRIGLVDQDLSTPDQVEDQLIKIVPEKWKLFAHHWLVLHGRYICKARKPMCDKCPITKYCKYYQSNVIDN